MLAHLPCYYRRDQKPANGTLFVPEVENFLKNAESVGRTKTSKTIACSTKTFEAFDKRMPLYETSLENSEVTNIQKWTLCKLHLTKLKEIRSNIKELASFQPKSSVVRTKSGLSLRVSAITVSVFLALAATLIASLFLGPVLGLCVGLGVAFTCTPILVGTLVKSSKRIVMHPQTQAQATRADSLRGKILRDVRELREAKEPRPFDFNDAPSSWQPLERSFQFAS